MPPRNDLFTFPITYDWIDHVPEITTTTTGTGNTYVDLPDCVGYTKANLDMSFITKREFKLMMEVYTRKIYEIITEHLSLDITEEEFVDLLKEV